MLGEEMNFAGLARPNRALMEERRRSEPVGETILDLDSPEVPVYGEEEQSSDNAYFESTCFQPLLVFHGQGDCLAAKLRPGNVHSAEGREELLLPEIQRQQKMGKGVAFRGDAAFARPEVYGALKERGVKYAIRIPANESLERDITELLPLAVVRPGHEPLVWYKVFCVRPRAGKRPAEWWRRRSTMRESCSPGGVHRDQPDPAQRAVVRFYNTRGTSGSGSRRATRG
jgi:Transposase DDE domain group 1